MSACPAEVTWRPGDSKFGDWTVLKGDYEWNPQDGQLAWSRQVDADGNKQALMCHNEDWHDGPGHVTCASKQASVKTDAATIVFRPGCVSKMEENYSVSHLAESSHENLVTREEWGHKAFYCRGVWTNKLDRYHCTEGGWIFGN